MVIFINNQNGSNYNVKVRTSEEKRYLVTRLKTIEGQVRGVMRMIDDDRYCNDILIQISAIRSSLKSLAGDIFKCHLETCVVEKIKDNHLEVLDDVMEFIKRLD